MSDSDRSVGSDEEEVLEFRCRKCPDKTFTAAEKDSHRMFHREQQEKSKKKPGPKSKTRRSARREPSPAASEVTLFAPVTSQKEKEPASKAVKGRGKRRRPDGSQDAGPSKRKTKKVYDEGVIGDWVNGIGA